MFKYDFDVDLSTETSTGKIIDKLSSGMTILEFGCGSGRMTKYMHEEMNCHVYIAEYDKDAFDVALQYAEDGICEDVQQFGWYERFKNIKFDCILLVDVLEHLVQCEAVLSKAKELLKPDGHIYISIPNVTHNDILIKAANDYFDYTPTGLLDNTHVHFWGLENIPSFVEKCGLNLDLVEATYAPMGYTEQFESPEIEATPSALNALRARKCGEIYEFILTLSLDRSITTSYDLRSPAIDAFVYFDCGDDFSPDNTYSFKCELISEGVYRFYSEISLPAGIKRIKIDPVEGQKCVLVDFVASQDGKNLTVFYADPIELSKGVLLNSDDPKLYINDIASVAPIIISGDIILEGDEFAELLSGQLIADIDQANSLKGELHQRDVSIMDLQKTLQTEIDNHKVQSQKAQEQFEESFKELQESHNAFVERLRGEYDEIIRKQNEEHQHTQLLLGSYRTIADVKDMALIAKEQQISSLNQQISGLHSQIDDLEYRYGRTFERQAKRFFRRAKNYLKKKLKLNRA